MHEIFTQKTALADFDRIHCIEGFERISNEYSTYLSDESKLSPEPFSYLFFPKDETELATILRKMSDRKIGVTIAGARTGLAGGCVPQKGALISLENFDQIQSVFYDNAAGEWRIQVQCAVTLRSLDEQITLKNFPEIERCGNPAALKSLKRFKQDASRYIYPPDPTEMSASIGGTVATNASGACTFRYGPTRSWVRGLRVMLPNAEILNIPRGKYFASSSGEFIVCDSKGTRSTIRLPSYQMPRTKNAAGFFTAPHMDLIDLFIGSEGCIGIITEVIVALLEHTDKISIVQFLKSDEHAIDLVNSLRDKKPCQFDFIEFYSGNALDLLRQRQMQEPKSVDMPPIPEQAKAALFFEFDFNPLAENYNFAALQKTLAGCNASISDSWAAYEKRELLRLKNFRHVLPETINGIIADRKKNHPTLHKLGTDLAVPDEHLSDMWQIYKNTLDRSNLQWVAFGHIGNNHLHINILPRNETELQDGLKIYKQLAAKAVKFGGSISAEHGIGKLKIKFLEQMYSPEQINEMKAVKLTIDPDFLLNPGNIFAIDKDLQLQ